MAIPLEEKVFHLHGSALETFCFTGGKRGGGGCWGVILGDIRHTLRAACVCTFDILAPDRRLHPVWGLCAKCFNSYLLSRLKNEL